MSLVIWMPAMFLLGIAGMAAVHPVFGSVRQNLKRQSEGARMIYITLILSAFLFVYLFTALVRPEWF